MVSKTMSFLTWLTFWEFDYYAKREHQNDGSEGSQNRWKNDEKSDIKKEGINIDPNGTFFWFLSLQDAESDPGGSLQSL